MLEKRKSKHNQSKNRKGRRHIYQIVEEHGEQISSLNAKMSEISTLSTHVSELMSVVSAKKDRVYTLGVTSNFPGDMISTRIKTTTTSVQRVDCRVFIKYAQRIPKKLSLLKKQLYFRI